MIVLISLICFLDFSGKSFELCKPFNSIISYPVRSDDRVLQSVIIPFEVSIIKIASLALEKMEENFSTFN